VDPTGDRQMFFCGFHQDVAEERLVPAGATGIDRGE
jgi:hypothetical protein